MIKNLMNNLLVSIDATKRAQVEFKRGSLVKANEATGELELATTIDDVTGVAVRDVVVTRDVAMGLPVSEFDLEQDTIKAGELCGHRPLYSGESFATDQYGDATALPDADAVAGKYLTVEDGQLVASPLNATTKFVSLGFQQVAGHKLLAYKVI